MQGESVVDTVAEEGDPGARTPAEPDDACLLLRIDPGDDRHAGESAGESVIIEMVDLVTDHHAGHLETEFTPHVCRDRGVVAGDDRDPKTESRQPADGSAGIGARPIAEYEQPDQFEVAFIRRRDRVEVR